VKGQTDLGGKFAFIHAHPRGLTLIVAVAVVMGAVVGYWTYASTLPAAAGPTRGPAMYPIDIQRVNATDRSNGPGGCSAVLNGSPECCYVFVLVGVAGLASDSQITATDNVVYLSTADLSFQIQGCDSHGHCASVSFVNNTLLDGPGGRILATYTDSGGWNAFEGAPYQFRLPPSSGLC
jgi:hypothetical protein